MPDELTVRMASELGIAELPPEAQEVLLEGFSEVALKAATAAVLEKLPEGKRDEFATLAEKGDPSALQVFLDREVPGHEALAGAAIVEEAKRFRESQKA